MQLKIKIKNEMNNLNLLQKMKKINKLNILTSRQFLRA